MSNVVKLKKKAAEFEQKKQFDRAAQAYIELLDMLAHDVDDADIPLYNRVGDLLMRENSAAEALVYYEKAVDLYSERGFLNNAIALCNKILRQSPGRSVIYYKLGKISATKGFKSDAKRNFLEYADRMEKSGRRDEAFRALKEFAQLCPDQDDVRLMLAEHLARDNRRDEAIEQLQVLHAKLEHEGRQAEARATLDRMKAINPEAEPDPSAMLRAAKSSDLVFLDVNDLPAAPAAPPVTPPRAATPPAPEPVKSTPPAAGIASPHTALEGLTIAFVPQDDDIAPPEKGPLLLDGFAPTSHSRTGGTPLYVDSLDGLDRRTMPQEQREGAPEAEPAASQDEIIGELVPDAELAQASVPAATEPAAAPASAIEPPAEPASAAEPAAEAEAGFFVDDTLSESEFAELELAPNDAPVAERPHDLALPSALPLLHATPSDGAPVFDDIVLLDADTEDQERYEPLFEPAAPEASGETLEIDLDAEIMAPISRGTPAHEAIVPVEELQSGDPWADGELVAISDLEPESEPSADLPETEAAVPRPAEAHAEAPPELPGETTPEAPPAAPAHSLEWEDLAVAAASHEVEPVSVPLSQEPPTSTAFPEVAEPFDLISEPASFGSAGNDASAGFSPIVLSPDTLAPIAGDYAEEPVSAELPDEPESVAAKITDDAPEAPAEVVPRRRTPARSIEAHALVATLRAQVDAVPHDAELRRRLGEALLEAGDRETGIRELDAAMRSAEEANDLATARELANEILRLVPESVRHHQKCVEYAVRGGNHTQLVEAYLQLADTLFRAGEHAKARAVYGRVVELEPAEPRALTALELLSDGPAPLPADAPADAPPRARPAVSAPLTLDIEAEIAAAFESAPEFEHATEEHVTPRSMRVADEGFVDLGALLRGDAPERSTRMVVEDATPSGDEQADFEDMLRRFKAGVEENVDDEDFDSHYDLGVAFKEMGLIDDAIAQFQKALRSDTHRSRAYEALGQCFVEKGQYEVAATLLSRAVETTQVDDRVLVGSLYLLAYACEQLRREPEALMYYQRVFAVDVDFRDVATRIRALESHAVT